MCCCSVCRHSSSVLGIGVHASVREATTGGIAEYPYTVSTCTPESSLVDNGSGEASSVFLLLFKQGAPACAVAGIFFFLSHEGVPKRKDEG